MRRRPYKRTAEPDQLKKKTKAKTTCLKIRLPARVRSILKMWPDIHVCKRKQQTRICVLLLVNFAWICMWVVVVKLKILMYTLCRLFLFWFCFVFVSCLISSFLCYFKLSWVKFECMFGCLLLVLICIKIVFVSCV